MQVLSLEIENVKRIQAMRIDPATGKPIFVTGDNGAGKSSVLDAILLALTNDGLEDPVRHGAGKATIDLKIGDETETYEIHRVVRKSGTRELVVTKDGKEISSPQRFLDGLIGSIAFDPLEFVRLKPKAQAEMLRQLLGINTAEIEKRKVDAYAERTVVNRQIEALKVQLDSTPMHADDVPDTEVSGADLIAIRDNVQDQRGKELALTNKLSAGNMKNVELSNRIQNGKALLEKLEKEKTELEAELRQTNADLESQREHVSKLPAIESIDAKIKSIDLTNEAVRQKRARAQAAAALERAKAQSDALTRVQMKADEEKASMLAAVDMPVPGMEIDSEGVTFKGVRFDQLSTAWQITMSARIAMRANPKLKIILIREGALINNANMRDLCMLAEEKGYQIWCEVFRESAGSKGIHIADGEITSVDGQEVAK